MGPAILRNRKGNNSKTATAHGEVKKIQKKTEVVVVQEILSDLPTQQHKGDIEFESTENERNKTQEEREFFELPQIIRIEGGMGCEFPMATDNLKMTNSASAENSEENQFTFITQEDQSEKEITQDSLSLPMDSQNVASSVELPTSFQQQNIIVTSLDGKQLSLVSNNHAALPSSGTCNATNSAPSALSSSSLFSLPTGFQLVNFSNVQSSINQPQIIKNVTTTAQTVVPMKNHLASSSKEKDKESEAGEVLRIDDNLIDSTNCNVKTEDSSVKNKTPVVTVNTSKHVSVTLQKFYFQQGLCRVCLLQKSHTTGIFDDVLFNDRGTVINVRGPHSVHFNIIQAIRTVLDIKVVNGDGLPDQICEDCLDHLVSFSTFRRQIAVGQSKLNEIVTQVQNSTNPTYIPALGETDFRKTDIFRHPDSILKAKTVLKSSKYTHLVQRSLTDRAWDRIFTAISSAMGAKSNKFESLEEYIYSSPYVSGWFCPICNYTVQGSQENYELHFKDVHKDDKKSMELQYPCDICGCFFPVGDRCSLTQNYRNHWAQHFFFHECAVCLKRFPSAKGLRNHTKGAHTEATEKCHGCETCGKSFKKKLTLDAHRKSHQIPDERKQCEICGLRLSGNLVSHMQTVHSDNRPWKCETCGKCFKRREILIVHRDTVHLNLKKYHCEICGDSFKSSSAKSIHVRRHNGEKPFTCGDCGKSFISINSLKSHEVKHQEVGTVNCPECDKVFKRKVYLAEHMKIHTNEKPHECPICGKCIRMKSNYFKHLSVHKRRDDKETEDKKNL